MPLFVPQRVTRRRTLEVLAAGVAAAAVPRGLFGQTLTFPKGAIIRTILKDYAPDELAGGATLFHEHLQLASDFGARRSRCGSTGRKWITADSPQTRGRGTASWSGHHARRGPDVR